MTVTSSPTPLAGREAAPEALPKLLDPRARRKYPTSVLCYLSVGGTSTATQTVSTATTYTVGPAVEWSVDITTLHVTTTIYSDTVTTIYTTVTV